MNTDLNKTLKAIRACLPENGAPGLPELKRAHRHTVRLYSQILAVIYDLETFGGAGGGAQSRQGQFARGLSTGKNTGTAVVLTICEVLPAMKRLTEAMEEHWKAMLHAAIREAAEQGPLPCFEKAFVEIHLTAPRGSDNARLWDTSNRAINLVINNLKGIFFEDDNLEHMAFSVVGRWGEEGVTMIRISELDGSRQIGTG